MRDKILNGFLERQNKRVNTFPKGFEETVKNNISKDMSNPAYFSVLTKDRIGIVEEVYGAKTIRNKVFIQKLAVIPESTKICPLLRNCYYVFEGMNAGFHSYGYTGMDQATNYMCYRCEDTLDWADLDFPFERIRRVQLFRSEDIAKLDARLEYNSFNGGAEIYAIDYLPLYRKYPVVCEALMKLGIKRMFTEKALSVISQNKSLAIWLSKHHKEVEYMAFQTAFNSYKKNPNCDPTDYLNSLLYRIECGKLASFSNKEIYKKVLLHTSQERIASYLKEMKIKKDLYGDYLEACDYLKLDFADTKVLFPKNFAEVHDAYTEQYSVHKREIERKKAEADFKDISDRMKAVAKKYSYLGKYKDESYCVVIACSKADLIDESCVLHHCVGKLNYDEKQAEGRSIICFIRKIDEPETPYVTTEVRLNASSLYVVQCYGENNRLAPEVDDFVKNWMESCNKKFKKSA